MIETRHWKKIYFYLNNFKFCAVKKNDRKVVITFVAIVLLGKFTKDVLTAKAPLELGTLVYKDLTCRNTKCELSGIFSFFVDFS